ncbi:MAG: hypothetical protein M3355_07545, partial [Actinomycetota bacterium]|nr:hypothetical protein [Actinomycetota bacterium]
MARFEGHPKRSALLALACLALTAPALAAKDSPKTQALNHPVSTPEGRAHIAAQAREAERREAEHKRALASPEARANRRRSRTAYKQFTSGQARELARDELSPYLNRTDAEPEKLVGSGRLLGFTDDFTMRVDPGAGRRAQLVVSTVPLRARSDDGVKRSVDLGLQEGESGFAPANPLVDAYLPKRLKDGIRLSQQGVTVVPEQLEGSDAHATKIHDQGLFYSEVELDTDLVVTTVNAGFETFTQLRSVESPERQRFRLKLPAGAELRPYAGGAEVVKDGRRVMLVHPPSASDAQGQSVPVELKVAGEVIELSIAHRDRDLAYPIQVDPLYEDWVGTRAWFNAPAGEEPAGLESWRYLTVPERPSYSGTTVCQVAPCEPRGLYVYANPGHFFLDDHFAEWLYQVPGQTTYIDQAQDPANYQGGPIDSVVLQYLRFRKRGTTNQYPYGYTTLYRRPGPTGTPSAYTAHRGELLGDPNPPPGPEHPEVRYSAQDDEFDAHVVAAGLYSPEAAPTLSAHRSFYVGGAVIRMTDPEAPAVQNVGNAGGEGWTKQRTAEVRPTVVDPGLGVKTIFFKDGVSPTESRTHPTCTGRKGREETTFEDTECPQSWTLPGHGQSAFSYETDTMPEGVNTIRVSGRDILGKLGTEATSKVRVDRSAPKLALSGSLKDSDGQALAKTQESYALTARATDGVPGGAASEQRSGAKSVEVFLTEERDKASDEQETRVAFQDQDCPVEGNCAREASYELRTADHDPGIYTVRVVAKDQLGQSKEEKFAFLIPPRQEPTDIAPDLSQKLGLEDYWQYESTETGAGSAAHVNLANGNLVWHATPLVNPGRGLSTFANLTFNSQQRIQLPLLETPVEQGMTPYDEAGQGFSLGISGLTRLNERLNVDLANGGRITLTDADGTRHLFKSDPGTDEVFGPPPGVQLHLRRYSKSKLLVDPPPALARPVLEEPNKTWAATRPDGVTYFFDQQGYQTSIEDRNGNKLTYHYEYRGPTYAVCQALESSRIFYAPATLCPRKVVRVSDAGGRDVSISYKPRVLADLPAELIPGGGIPVEVDGGTLETATFASGRISEITDHAGRSHRFSYDSGPGYLQSITQAAGTSAARTFQFAYEPVDPLAPTKLRGLEAVTDPRGKPTRINYDPNGALGLLDDELKAQLESGLLGDLGRDSLARIADGALSNKRVESLKDRRESESTTKSRAFRYERRDDGGQRYYDTFVADARSFETRHTMDSKARPIERLDAKGTKRTLAWDPDNNLAELVDAKGSADEATTRMTYNLSGQLLTRTDPKDHTTQLTYFDSPGTIRSPRPKPPPASGNIDDSGTFVSDPRTISKPKGGTSEFGYDARGNVIERKNETGQSAFTDYDALGQITREQDEVGNETFYSEYDPNGMPQTVKDPRANFWRYRYDPVGNVKATTDPRGSGGGGPDTPNSPFTTTLTYDSLDRLTTEAVPKRSEQGSFITRQYEYDANDNQTAQIDGNGKRTERTWTAMDDPAEFSSPPTPHAGEGASSEVTTHSYDAEENLIAQRSPKGSATGTDGDFTTVRTYDEIGRKIVETRQSRADGPDADLVTSQAYDRRDNIVGLADPRRNAQGGDPKVNAASSAGQRFAYAYDKASNRISQIENPAGLAHRTTYSYDDNDNLETQTDPRGSASSEEGDFTTRYEYDARDLPTGLIDGMGRKTELKRRGDGKVTEQVKPKGTAAGPSGDFETKLDYLPTGELKSRSLPYAENQYGSTDLKWSYTRNAVGDPTTITDPRAKSFQNTFFDSGELRTTERPSAWKYDAQGGGRISERSPEEIGDAEQWQGNGGKEQGQGKGGGQSASSEQGESAMQQGQVGGAGDSGLVKREQMPEPLPLAGLTTFAYDGEMRLTEIKDTADKSVQISRDPLGRALEMKRPLSDTRDVVDKVAYDRNGNPAELNDGEGHKTTNRYDQFDRKVEERRPGSTDEEVTLRSFDPNGNVTSVQTPRG